MVKGSLAVGRPGKLAPAYEVMVKDGDGPSTPRPKDVKELLTLTQVRQGGQEKLFTRFGATSEVGRGGGGEERQREARSFNIEPPET